MHTVRIQEKPPGRKTLADAKDKFLQDLQRALAKEQTIASHISRVEKVPAPTLNATSDIRLRFGFMESFVRHVREKRTHVKNAEKLQELIDNTRLELAALRTPAPGKVTIKRTLNIHFKKGVIKPTDKVEERLLPRYHWEMQSGAQSWSQIGDKGAQEISPGLVDGEVRLSYRDGKLVSNKIKISTVIKRQAASAKRQQYRFAPGDPEFEQRCAGVAGQIRRLLTPPRHIVDGDFHSRVLQDRVACLPEHLNLEVVDVIDLCETGTTADADYVHMVEFVEPTIYLNPKRLHTELKDIYAGNRISLRLPSRETGTAPAVVPARPSLLMLDEDILAQAQRNGDDERERRRRRREQERLDQLEREQRAQEDAALIAREQAEAARQAQEDADRIAREQAEAARQAREEADRIAREQAKAAQKAQEEEQARAEEVRLAEQRAKETAERLQRERELLEQQQLESERTAMKVYATKKKGVENSGPNEWFVTVKDKVYKTNSTGKDASVKPVGDADADGWYVDADAVALAKEQLENERTLARERKRLAREAKEAAEQAEAERQRLEQERLQQEAQAEAERQRLEQERLQQEAQAEAERQRLAAEERTALIAALREDTEQLKFVKYVFTTYDTDANGRITVSELGNALRSAGRDANDAEQLVRENDLDANGSIDEDEFIVWCAVSSVMEDKSWKDAETEFRAKQLAATGGESKSSETQESTFQSVVVNQILPYFIGDVAKVRATIDASANKSAWETENTVQELTKKITGTYQAKLAEFLQATGASAWLDAGDVMRMSQKDSGVRIFYVPKRPDKAFAYKAGGLPYINAKAICTMEVEKNVFETASGRSARGDVFVLKDIATTDRGAKFLLASALEKMQAANPTVQTLLTQPFNGNGFEERAAKFSQWGLRPIAAKLPVTATPVNNLMMLGEEDEKWSAPKPGELSAMVENMTDWVSSDEELNFAEQSEAESMEFAASSSLDTDSELEFAQSSERSLGANSSEEEVTSGKTSSGMEFAESSAAESDSDMEFAESSDKTSSGLEFAESSAVDESD